MTVAISDKSADAFLRAFYAHNKPQPMTLEMFPPDMLAQLRLAAKDGLRAFLDAWLNNRYCG